MMMELDYKAIGKRIKIARINADMTQEALAAKVNLSPSHMSNIETGTTKVSLTTIVNIANALSVTVDDLLCDNLVRARIQMEHDIQAVLDGSAHMIFLRVIQYCFGAFDIAGSGFYFQ